MYLLDTTTTQALASAQTSRRTHLHATDSVLDKVRIQINLGTYHIARRDWSTAKAYFENADDYLQ